MEKILISRAKNGEGFPYSLELEEFDELKDINIELSLFHSFVFLKIDNSILKKINGSYKKVSASKFDVLKTCFTNLTKNSDKFNEFMDKSELDFALVFDKDKKKLTHIRFDKNVATTSVNQDYTNIYT